MKILAILLALSIIPVVELHVAIGQQPKESRPLLIIKVQNEGTIGTRPSEILDLSPQELNRLKQTLVVRLSKVYEIIPESDKRDCIELGVTAEKLPSARGIYYIASSAIAVGKGDADLLLSHNVVVQPTIEKVGDAINYQLLLITVQSQIRTMGPK